ncbi:MAG: DUF1887 family protein [Chloroflexi bacterium]|nr:DUF1887 family protein [Chloroflexota bacterium]
MKTLVSLIGEQIIPNLLPLKYFKPDESLAVFSNFTRKGYERLEKAAHGQVIITPCEVDAYNIDAILPVLHHALGKWDISNEFLFNITGGTKPMSIAAYLVAGQLNAPVIYIQSEGKRSRILRYEFRAGKSVMTGDEIMPAVITLDEYLRAHVEVHPPRQRAQNDEGYSFEGAVFDVLSDSVDEIKVGINIQGVVELDLAVRCDNQVGIVEVKTGSNKLKMAIDQLNTAGEQRYLGTYTQKFLVSDQDWSAYSDLMELAKAHRITVIELPSYAREGVIGNAEKEKLKTLTLNGLGKAI